MQKQKQIINFFLFMAIMIIAFSCGNNTTDNSKPNQTEAPKKELKGYIYTTTNGEGENQVVQLSQYSDGSLGEEKIYLTGDKGGSDSQAPVNGDYDSQGAIQIIDKFLLCINTGGHSISVFSIDKSTGDLEKIENVPSHGERPVSIAFTKSRESQDEYWVAIANQWGTPTALFENDEYVELPNSEFYENDLKAKHTSDQSRNVTLYKFNSSTGSLQFVSMLDTYKRYWGGPVQVSFSGDGTKLAVTTWGIPHFVTSSPKPDFVKPSHVHVYNFIEGAISNKLTFEEEGLIGAVGFNWSKNDSLLYVSYFNPIKEKDNEGFVVLRVQDDKIVKVSAHETGAPADIDYACWTAVSPNYDRVYVVSFGTNVITPYQLDDNGYVSSVLPYTSVGESNPANDIKDVYITSDNKYAYCLGSFQTFTIKQYKVTDSGLDFTGEYSVKETLAQKGNTGVYDFQGLIGYSLEKK